MWIKRSEYKVLLDRVYKLENEVYSQHEGLFKSWHITEQHIEELINRYIERKCCIVFSNDIKNKIKASLQKKMIDNLFKEEE